MDEANEIKRTSDFRRLDELETKVIDLQLDALKAASKDHETRIRQLEETATKVNTLLALVLGGGILSAINLVVLLFNLSK